MKYRINQKNQNELSMLGFGAMRLPETEGKIDYQKSFELIDYAYQNGVNYFDTAYPYHDGLSESFLGEALSRYPRDSYFLATKLPIYYVESKEDVLKFFNEQLTKLKTDYIDYYLIHAVNEERAERVIKYDVYNQLLQLKNEGKIRNLGFSFHDKKEVFFKFINQYSFDFCLLQLNYLDQDHQQGLDGYYEAVRLDIPVFIMEPLKGGKLAKFNPKIEKIFKEYNPNASVASWAFRFISSFPNVKVVLSGMSTLEDLKDNLNTYSNFTELNEKELSLVDKVIYELTEVSKIGCTKCNYCMPCSFGVDIPGNFQNMNQYAMYDDLEQYKKRNQKLTEKKADASQCVSCQACIEKCPQNIDIPKELANIADYFK